jgi:uncharacterized iron-regulated membrane protein
VKRLRSILFWSHLTGGAIAGGVIFIMCASGALLAMKPQILNIVEHDVRFVAPQSSPRLKPSELLATVVRNQPGVQPMSIVENRDPSFAVSVAVAGNDTLYVNPYTGAVLGHGSARAQAFFRSAEDWHRWLAMSNDDRATARQATDAATFVFFLLAASGLFLWWPRAWTLQHTKAVFWFRRAATPRARDFNWHNVIGFWSSAAILVMTMTGIVMAYPWANNLLYRMAGSPLPQQNAPRAGGPQGQNGRGGGDGQGRAAEFRVPANIDAIWARAGEAVPSWGTINMRLAARGPVTFSITDGAYWNAYARSNLTVDAATADISRWEPYTGTTAGQKARGWVRFAHTGELGGWPGQLALGAGCLGGMFLVWTGWSLAVRRLFARRNRTGRQKTAAARAA